MVAVTVMVMGSTTESVAVDPVGDVELGVVRREREAGRLGADGDALAHGRRRLQVLVDLDDLLVLAQDHVGGIVAAVDHDLPRLVRRRELEPTSVRAGSLGLPW